MTRKIQLLIILATLCATISFSFVDPKYEGVLDLRYVRSNNLYKGTGSFNISDIQLNVKFPLNKHYLVFYETHLMGNIEQFEQLFLDIDGFALPVNLKLGRFRVPFGNEKINQSEKYFISNTVQRDAIWGNGSYLIPREENGLDIYYHSRVFSADLFLVNGNGEISESANDKAGKSVGLDLRFLLKDVVDVGLSAYYNDLSTPSSNGVDNQYLLLGTDYKFSVYEIDFEVAYLLATGKLNGSSKEVNALSGQIVIPYEKDLLIGLNTSYHSSSTMNDYRHILSLSYIINQDITLKTEYYIDRINDKKDWRGQVQLLVRI
ncbi:MAG: hypothetical protein A2Y40_08575 [Candidatus Margulisbacteria bacterium GWF2_35_9]|nr:MAG: hypothetical protein A2Y40_08575 [Candidatus Margulisbacteria bacterium GWF2_35_9]